MVPVELKEIYTGAVVLEELDLYNVQAFLGVGGN